MKTNLKTFPCDHLSICDCPICRWKKAFEAELRERLKQATPNLGLSVRGAIRIEEILGDA